MMKLNGKVLILAVMVLAAFIFIPFSYGEEEDFISVSPVEKQDNSRALESGSVQKITPAAAAMQVEAVKPAEKPAEKPAATASKGNKIENILPLDLKDKMEIRIMTSSPVKYKTTELASPPNPRILIQLINCGVKSDTKSVDKSNVGKIRTAPHSSTAWVVIDLKDRQKWDVTQNGSTLSVNIPKGAAASSRPAAEREAAAPAARPGSLMYRVIDVAGKNILKKTRVIITTDGPVKYRVKKDTDGKFLSINIQDAVSIWHKDSVEVSQGTVTKIAVSEKTDTKKVEVRINMSENAPYTVTRDQNQIIVDVDNVAGGNKKVKKNLDLYQRISLNIQDASLTSVLRLLSTQTGFEFSVSPGATIATLVTIREDDQTLDKVLNDILIPQGTYYELSDGIIRIGTTMELKLAKSLRPKITKFYTPRNTDPASLLAMVTTLLTKEPLMDVATQVDPSSGSNRLMLVGTHEDINKAMDMIADIDAGGESNNDSEGGSMYKTKVFKLENVRLQIEPGNIYEEPFITDLKLTLQNMMTSPTLSKFSIDRRTSSIIVTETVPNLKKIEKMIKALDERVPQVAIEAKLYEVDVTAEKDLGVSWNVKDNNNQPYINGDSTLGGGAFLGSGLTGGTLNIGTLLNGFKFDASIRALESRNKATLLSAPKVAVDNNQPATITTNKTVYYEVQTVVTSNAGPPTITSAFSSIVLPIQLKVWCKTSKDGFINMRVDVQVSKIVPTNRIAGPPDTSIQEASTYIKAKNNETVVIAGLINENIADIEEKVPLLGDLPLIGGLFRGTKKTTEKVELVVFLTPSIVEE